MWLCFFFSDTFPGGGGGVFSGFEESRDRKEYSSQTKPNIYRNGFENFRIVESQIREKYGPER